MFCHLIVNVWIFSNAESACSNAALRSPMIQLMLRCPLKPSTECCFDRSIGHRGGFAFRARHHWVLLEPSLANAVLYKAKYNNQGLPSVGFGSFYLSWFCCTLHRKKYCSSLKMMTSRRMRMQCLSGLVGKEGCTGCLRCPCKLTWSGTECNINAEPASTILVSSTEITARTNAR